MIAAVGAALAATIAAATPASAHVGKPTNGFADGVLHPLLGPDHLLAMVAVGIVAAVVGAQERGPLARLGVWAAPAAFVCGMVAGGVVGIAGWAVPSVELAIVLSVIALGCAVAGAVGSLAGWLPLLVAAGFAHGNARGLEAPSSGHPALSVLGFVVATVALHATGVASGVFVRRRPLVRAAIGSSVAAAGVLLLLGG